MGERRQYTPDPEWSAQAKEISEATRAKMKEAAKRRWEKAEERAKMSEKMKGREFSQETRLRMKESQLRRQERERLERQQREAIGMEEGKTYNVSKPDKSKSQRRSK